MVEWFLDEKFIEVQIFLGLYIFLVYKTYYNINKININYCLFCFKNCKLITLSEYLNNN